LDDLMSIMRHLRVYHALLAILVVLAYLTGEDNALHAWLGYGVAAIILLRIAWALTGVPQLGLMRFYPHFEGLHLKTAMAHPAISRTLLLSIAVCLITVSLTGIAMDRGATILAGAERAAVTQDYQGLDGGDGDDSLIGEVHETVANLLILLVVTHVAYLLLFKRPVALFMLFFHTPSKKDGTP
jgi:cytochrome b